jgi:hypothetical protein
MSHRLREAMRVLQIDPLGGAGKEVEADETFIGQKRPKAHGARGYAHKHAVVSLVERGGRARSTHVNDVNAATLRPILKEQIRADSWLMTNRPAITALSGANSGITSQSNIAPESMCVATRIPIRLKGFFDLQERE